MFSVATWTSRWGQPRRTWWGCGRVTSHTTDPGPVLWIRIQIFFIFSLHRLSLRVGIGAACAVFTARRGGRIESLLFLNLELILYITLSRYVYLSILSIYPCTRKGGLILDKLKKNYYAHVYHSLSLSLSVSLSLYLSPEFWIWIMVSFFVFCLDSNSWSTTTDGWWSSRSRTSRSWTWTPIINDLHRLELFFCTA